MIFNFWRRYPRRKPKEDGFYLCTIPMGTTDGYVRKLMYSTRTDKWTDIYRQKVFDGYVVYKVCRAPIEENRVRTDGMCDRTDEVVAWKKIPKPYHKRRKGGIHGSEEF